MSLWRRLFPGPPEDKPLPPPAEPRVAEAVPREDLLATELSQLAVLLAPGDSGGTAEALALLRRTRETPEQARVLEALAAMLAPRAAHDALRVACAQLLEEQGRVDDALALAGACASVDGLMLTADLHAARGELARAIATVERVLARALDAPGARERHERWCAQLGLRGAPTAVDAGATVVAPAADKTSFRLLREVARGGAGTVYEAEDELLGRRLAFKVYHRGEADRAPVEREARSAVALRGPGVLRIFDADPSGGWIASEWIARGSLRDALRGGRVTELSPVSRWLVPLCRALARVHAAGLVHGDLKPANVLFRAIDDPVLGDFGACQRSGLPALGGTPGYLSPERLAGGVVDARDDVYALGRLLEDALAALGAHPEREALAQLARACLADPADRPADGPAVLRMLRTDP